MSVAPPSSTATPLSRSALAALVAPPVVAVVAYILYTGQIWEDFLITYRHTENLVRGQGLVYQPGERVHGFTSVLNTLLPALPHFVAEGLMPALRFFQFVSVLTLAAGLAALFGAMRRRLGSSWVELGLVSAFVACSVKIVAFAGNGQEAGLLVGFLGLGLAAALELDRPGRWWRLGLAWAGLLYTRPDSPVAMLATVFVAWSVRPGAVRAVWHDVLRAAGVAALAFAPWVLVAWNYYGSPIPHTLVAKSSGSLFVNDSALATLHGMWAQFIVLASDVFGPIYGPGGWPGPLMLVVTAGGLVAAVFCLLPGRDRFARACSAGVLCLLVYLSWVDVQRQAYPWYFPPVSLLGAIVVARIATAPWRDGPRGGVARGIAATGTGALFLAALGCLLLSFHQMRIQQSEIEVQTRQEIGTWLRARAAANDRVYLECLGYIGYYYGGKMLDFPGLVSPEVVAVRRERKADITTVPVHLLPEWIVARPGAADALAQEAAIRERYEVAATFDASSRLDRHGDFPGKSSLLFDSQFYVLRRR